MTSLSALWLAGCSGSGVGLDPNADPITGQGAGGNGGPVPLSADFDSIQANVFTPICTACHVGASAPQGLILDAQHSYSLLVGIPSTEVPSILRVAPGNPDNSYLIQKLEGHAAVGQQMPLDETPLPVTTIAFIRQWITDGAQAGAAAAQAVQAFAVASLAPDDGDVVPEPPTEVVVSFTRDLDAGSALDQTVRLERLSGPSASDVATRVAARLSIPTGNARTLVLTPQEPLPPGEYRVVLSGQAGFELGALDGSHLGAPAPNPQGLRIIDRFSVASP